MTTLSKRLRNFLKDIDWILVGAIIPIVFFSLVTMNSFVDDNAFFQRQLIWILLGFCVMFGFSLIDFKFLRRTSTITWLFVISVIVLVSLFAVGTVSQGAQRWLNFGLFAVQPSELVKLVLILVLAKYFSRRHVEIRNIRHVIVSGIYAFILFFLVLVQPDFGSSIIIFLIWFGMVMVSGISKRHLALVLLVGAIAFGFLWTAVLQDYQKDRIMTFVNPLEDIQGAGYNAYQSTITVGSGQIIGKGIGYGTQSRLKFLPEYETDFIFAAFAEEWGFVGVVILFVLFGVIIWRILNNALHGATNFEILFGMGLTVLIICHFTIHVGMNIGLLPVTGTTIPLMSYGGTHIMTTFIGLGILMGMRRYRRAAHKDQMKNEFLGVG
jgi:rod shape determining protein RodA